MLHGDVFVRLISFKLKDANMILSEFCGGMQPGDHCLVISVKCTRSGSTMAFFLFFSLRKPKLISFWVLQGVNGRITFAVRLRFS